MRPTLRAAMDRLGRADHDHVTLREEAAALLRRHLDFDVAVWATVDPVTIMWTHCLLDGQARDQKLEHAIFVNEFSEEDVCKLTDLLASARPVGTIHMATGGDPSRSARFRDLLAPLGARDELRLVFRDGDAPWGALHLLRDRTPFDTDEVDTVAELSQPLASALRRSLVRAAVEDPGTLTDPPGVIELTPDGVMADISPEAEALLEPTDPATVPQVVAAVVARRFAGSPAVASLPTRDGRWLGFTTTALGGRVVVIVERLAPQRLADIIARTHGLTAREREVVELVARGRSTRSIAQTLFISEWTVQDHLKSIFGKFGVSSRSELVGALFFGHYVPEHDEGATPSPYGWYLR